MQIRLTRLLVTIAAVAALSVLPATLGTAAPATDGSESNWTLDGVPCSLIEVPAAAPVGTGPCPGVRPGAIVNSDVGQCTFNFLFLGSDGRRYVGTAGHCILGESPIGGDVGEQSWAPGTGPEARDANDVRIGEFHFGGPTGINADTPSSLVTLEHYGNGVGVGSVVPARTALAIGMPDPDHVFAQGVVVPGDSGSGIISSDGRAVGVIVTVGIHSSSIGTDGIDAGDMGITRLPPQLARAQQILGLTLTLQTAPTL